MSVYSFPLLSNGEILRCLSEMDVSCDEAALTKPSPDGSRVMFEQIVECLVGVSKEELSAPVGSAMDVIEFPELHDDSLPRMAMHRALMALMKASGVHDFELRDIYKADYPRLRRCLSAVINFAKFREEAAGRYEELKEASEATMERRQALREEAARLRDARELQLAARRAEEPEVEATLEACDGLAARVASMNKEQAALQGDVRALKAQGVEAGERLKADKAALQEAAAERDDFESQIVTSPEKLKAQLEMLTAKTESERAATAAANDRAKQLHMRLDALSRAQQDISEASEVMDEAQGEVMRHKGVAKKVKELKGALKVSQDENWELEAEKQQLARQHASVTDKLTRLANAASVKREQGAAYVVSMEEGKAAAEAAIAKDKARAAAAEHATAEARRAATELAAEHAGDVENILKQYDALRAQVDSYHHSLAEAMHGPPSVAATPAPVGA